MPGRINILKGISDYGFCKSKGKEFYYKGEPILFSGLGVGSWLNMEHFMLGLPGTDAQIRKTFEEVLGKEDGEKFLNLLF